MADDQYIWHLTPAKIWETRTNHNLTQAGAAEKIYCTARTWRQWEAGERRMHRALWEFFLLQIESA